jgi:hypothetical protein
VIGRIAAFALLLLLPIAGSAWEHVGHALVADLAEQRLRPATREAALALLAPGDRSLASIASWPDGLRKQAEFGWTASLHYVNMPDCMYDAARDCVDGRCAIDAIRRYRDELADRSLPAAKRAEALKFLVHLVGDVHQPFHASPRDDRGANQYQISLDGEGTNLHSIWDSHLLDPARIDIDALRTRLQAAASPAAGSRDPQDWALESCRLIDAHALYPPGHTLDQTYLQRHQPLAEQRVLLAAERLRIELEAALGAEK